MTFNDIPNGAALFVDANVFVYAFSRHTQYGPACRGLLERIDRQEIYGQTATHILTETAHRLMTLDACATFGWPIASIAQRLKQHPVEVRKLSAYRRAIADILASQIQIAGTPPTLVLAAAGLSSQHGLLSNDALVVAVMQAYGLMNIASNDADFDRVPGLIR